MFEVTMSNLGCKETSEFFDNLTDAVRLFMAIQKQAYRGQRPFPSLIDHETGKRWN